MFTGKALLLVGLFGAANARAAVGALSKMEYVRGKDSVQIDFFFNQGRPSKFRIWQHVIENGSTLLEIDIFPASADPRVLSNTPHWMLLHPQSDGTLSATVVLTKGVPFRSEWHDQALRVMFLDHIPQPSVWSNPWLYAGVSAVVAAGATAWILSSGTSPTPPPTPDNVIPPLDVPVPK